MLDHKIGESAELKYLSGSVEVFCRKYAGTSPDQTIRIL